MKEMKCLDCEKTFKAETSDEMIKTMMPHYAEDHAEMIKEGTEEKRAIWMKKFQEEWEKAEEVAENE